MAERVAVIGLGRMGGAMGLTLETMLAFLKDSPGVTPTFRARIPKMTGEDETVGFAIDAVMKDNTLFLAVAERFAVDLPELRHARERLAVAIAAGLGGADPAAIVRFELGNACGSEFHCKAVGAVARQAGRRLWGRAGGRRQSG